MSEQQMTPIELRRAEVAQYQANIAMFEAIYATLPHEWPEHLEQYRNSSNQHQTADKVENLEDVALLAQLWYADEVHKAIRAETVEMTKAKAILDVLEAN